MWKKQFVISLIISSAFVVSQFEIHLFFIVYDISRTMREKKKKKQNKNTNILAVHNYTHTYL